MRKMQECLCTRTQHRCVYCNRLTWSMARAERDRYYLMFGAPPLAIIGVGMPQIQERVWRFDMRLATGFKMLAGHVL